MGDVDRIYQRIGQLYVLNFAATTGVKKVKDSCKTGFPCGYSCISKTKNCKSGLEGQAKTYADWLSGQASKAQPAKSKTATPKQKTAKQKTIQEKPASSAKAAPQPEPQPKQPKTEPKQVKVPSESEASKLFPKIGEGENGAVYLKDGVAYKYGKISVDEMELSRAASNLGVGPKILGGDRKGYAMEFLGGHSTFYEYRGTRQDTATTNRNIVNSFRTLHEGGIAHGDAHGGNFLINKNTKEVKIIDYGRSERDYGLMAYDISVYSSTAGLSKTKGGKAFNAALSKLNQDIKAQSTDQGKKNAISEFYNSIADLDFTPTKR